MSKTPVTAWPMGDCGYGPTPDYVTAYNFRDFVAYGLGVCWLSHDPNDLNADTNMARPLVPDDVTELRTYFLETLEDVIYFLWNGDLEPGSGDVDSECKSVIIGDDEKGQDVTFINWHVSLHDDAIMMELYISEGDGTAIFLDYDAIKDRENVVKVLIEARQYADGTVWEKLVEAAKISG